jgi:hypothetical protein
MSDTLIERRHKTLLGETGAIFSPCEQYRYRLWRRWSEGPWCNFLMLNPSKANELVNDPTVERCERRAQDMGFGGLIVTNLFAYRSTDPAAMLAHPEPNGDFNDCAIIEAAEQSDMVICAWGGDGGHLGRARVMEQALRLIVPDKLHYLKWSKTGGFPWHPLYVGYAHKPVRWEAQP